MTKFLVKGGNTVKGSVKVSGSKNAALPIFCASLLTKEKVTLRNVPDISDIRSMIKILTGFGAKISFSNNTLEIDPSQVNSDLPPDDVVKKMRSSILVLGALINRLGEVNMAFPGGCVLGKRSISVHTHALQALGAKIIEDKTRIHIKADKLKGAKIILPEMSVTGTENAIMAAVLAEGKTEIRLAAAEPHVQDLCHFLNSMGAKIENIGSNSLKITGVKELSGTDYSITGDYLEAGTFMIAAAATNGELLITGINPDHLDSVIQKFKEIGVTVTLSDESILVHKHQQLKPTNIRTAVYPSFPTDLQAPFTVLLTQAQGVSRVFETLFEGRLNYLFELQMMGAHVEYLNPHQALLIGPKKLKGMPISSYDIRAGAAMIIASIMAEGETEITNINYIDRGYEKFENKLRSIGIDIVRVDSN